MNQLFKFFPNFILRGKKHRNGPIFWFELMIYDMKIVIKFVSVYGQKGVSYFLHLCNILYMCTRTLIVHIFCELQIKWAMTCSTNVSIIIWCNLQVSFLQYECIWCLHFHWVDIVLADIFKVCTCQSKLRSCSLVKGKGNTVAMDQSFLNDFKRVVCLLLEQMGAVLCIWIFRGALLKAYISMEYTLGYWNCLWFVFFFSKVQSTLL